MQIEYGHQTLSNKYLLLLTNDPFDSRLSHEVASKLLPDEECADDPPIKVFVLRHVSKDSAKLSALSSSSESDSGGGLGWEECVVTGVFCGRGGLDITGL